MVETVENEPKAVQSEEGRGHDYVDDEFGVIDVSDLNLPRAQEIYKRLSTRLDGSWFAEEIERRGKRISQINREAGWSDGSGQSLSLDTELGKQLKEEQDKLCDEVVKLKRERDNIKTHRIEMSEMRDEIEKVFGRDRLLGK